MRTYYIFCLGLISLFTLGSCASTSSRSPASANADSQSVELAQKLNGGEVKFQLFRDKKDISVLGYLNIKFKNCSASVASGDLTETSEIKDDSYVDCDIDFNSDPAIGSIRAQVKGNKRNFTVKFKATKSEEYNLEAKLNIYYENKTWKGNGDVVGWVRTKIGKGTSINAEVKETASF